VGLEPVRPVGSRAKPMLGVWARSPQKPTTLVCENMLFGTGFKMHACMTI